MIQLIPTENDEIGFLSLAERIVNGAIAALDVREVFLVHVDNWFDHKWLGWWTSSPEKLRIPPFTPKRVQSEKRFVLDPGKSIWNPVALRKPLHIPQPGRHWLALPIDRIANSAAFIWYSGNTTTNKAGSLLLYRSNSEGYSWYASLKQGDPWTIADECRTTRRELLHFEQCGTEMELART